MNYDANCFLQPTSVDAPPYLFFPIGFARLPQAFLQSDMVKNWGKKFTKVCLYFFNELFFF